MKAVILAGGLGTRLLPYTKTLPKPMLPLGKKPILDYVIKWIKKNGVKDIVLCVSYKHEKIKSYFKDGSKFGNPPTSFNDISNPEKSISFKTSLTCSHFSSSISPKNCNVK